MAQNHQSIRIPVCWLPLLVLALLLYGGMIRYVGPGMVDDTFISLRYAKNFLDGEGVTWNPGDDRVEGYTSLAWVMLVAAGSFGLVDKLPQAALALSIFWGGGLIVASWLIALWCFRVRPAVAILVPLHLGASPFLARHAVSGMETTFTAFALLSYVVLVMWMIQKASPWRAALLGLVAGAITLIRPDTIFFTMPAALAALTFVLIRTGREGCLRPAISFAVSVFGVIGVYMVWKYFYYGHLVPAPALFKAGLRETVRHPTFVISHWFTFAAAVALPAGIIAIGAATRRSFMDPSSLAILCGTTLFALYFLTVLPVMSYQFRYLFPVYPIVFLLGAVMTDRLLPENPARMAMGLFALIFVGCNIVGLSESRRSALEQTERYQHYGEFGKELSQLEGLHIALTEAGQLAYFSNAKVTDLLGLNDRTIAMNRHRGRAFARDFRVYLEGRVGLPDLYTISTPEASWATPAVQPELFGEHYDIIAVEPVLLAVRRDSPHGDALRELIQRHTLR
ncbi:MAG: hypothetical protein JJU11_00545 [Candidatus Sumerlaeia bacterium]|nr:hypothetical protein [Candidatus Sumerlaeia bacterium]